MSTSASTPNAVTVSNPAAVFFGWPLTYLNEKKRPSLVGINSITPSTEWLAMRADFSKSGQRA